MNEWEKDKKWSDKFIPEIQVILASNLKLFEVANDVEDREHNTDLLTLRDIRVACRIRKFDKFKDYGNQFTIRSMRPSGNKTELIKIVEGLGRYMLYGFADAIESRLHSWIIIDLNSLRGWLWEMDELAGQPGIHSMKNHDGTGFLSFDMHYLKDGIVVARSETRWVI